MQQQKWLETSGKEATLKICQMREGKCNSISRQGLNKTMKGREKKLNLTKGVYTPVWFSKNKPWSFCHTNAVHFDKCRSFDLNLNANKATSFHTTSESNLNVL